MTKKEILKLSKTVKPYNKSVLIIRDSGEQKLASGIIMPDTKMKKDESGNFQTQVIRQSTGIVIGKGAKCEGEYQIGDRVKFNHFCDTEFTLDGFRDKIIIMTDMDVYCGIPHNLVDTSMSPKTTKRPSIPRPDFSQLKELEKE